LTSLYINSVQAYSFLYVFYSWTSSYLQLASSFFPTLASSLAATSTRLPLMYGRVAFRSTFKADACPYTIRKSEKRFQQRVTHTDPKHSKPIVKACRRICCLTHRLRRFPADHGTDRQDSYIPCLNKLVYDVLHYGQQRKLRRLKRRRLELKCVYRKDRETSKGRDS
jgi:hypothetical protein